MEITGLSMKVTSGGGSGPTRLTWLGSTSTCWWTSSSARPTARTRPGRFCVWINPIWVWAENTWSTGLMIRLDFRSYLSLFVSLCLFFYVWICLYMSICLYVSLCRSVSLCLSVREYLINVFVDKVRFVELSASICLSVSLSMFICLDQRVSRLRLDFRSLLSLDSLFVFLSLYLC